MATTMLPPGFGGIVGVPSTYGPKIVRALGPSFDINDRNSLNYLISGSTKDSTGTALGNCDVHLFTTLDDLEVQQSVSDASGHFALPVHSGISHYIVAYKSGSPDVAGTTIDTLVGLAGVTYQSLSIDDFYSESNLISHDNLDSDPTDAQGLGQAFRSNGGTLDSAQFSLKRQSNPTGNISAKLYAVTGTYGTTAIPTGTALATSDVIDVSTIPTTDGLFTFNFTGANRYLMINGTTYCIVLEYAGGDSSNFITLHTDNTSPTHAGNQVYLQSGAWNANASIDACFYVYRIS